MPFSQLFIFISSVPVSIRKKPVIPHYIQEFHCYWCCYIIPLRDWILCAAYITPLKWRTFQHHYWTDGETADFFYVNSSSLNRWWARVCWQSSVLKQSRTDILVFIIEVRTSAAFKIELRKRFHLRNWPNKACMIHVTAFANEKILLNWPFDHRFIEFAFSARRCLKWFGAPTSQWCCDQYLTICTERGNLVACPQEIIKKKPGSDCKRVSKDVAATAIRKVLQTDGSFQQRRRFITAIPVWRLPLTWTCHKALGVFKPLGHILEIKRREIVSETYVNHLATYSLTAEDALLGNSLGQRLGPFS